MANKFPTNQSFQRLTSKPLDETMVFNTLAQAQDYASNNPTAYKGQVIHVKDARTSSEINEGVFIYEETCYIDLLKNVVPICSFSYEAMGMFFDLMNEILNNPTENTRDKIDALKEIMYDNYAHDFKEVPTGDYKTQPWHPGNYNNYQIALKMTQNSPGNVISNYSGYKVSVEGANYNIEDITIKRNGQNEFYKIITLDSFPTKVSFYYGSYIEKVIHMCDTSNVTNMTNMFRSCNNLTSLDTSNWDTSNVTTMYGMFNQCKALTSLDVSNWNTEKVTDMTNMFRECAALTSLDVSNFNTSKVTHMTSMFQNCAKLTSLDVSKWNTSNVIDMGSMFYECSALTSIDISNFNTTKVTNMNSMFCNCASLTSFNVNVDSFLCARDSGSMFARCSSLTQLDVSNFDTSNVRNMSAMFAYCSNLTELDVSNFDTSNVTDMSSMFRFCPLISLDLSNFDTSKVTDIRQIFEGCSGLTELNLSNWDLSSFNYDSFREFTGTNNLRLSNIDMSNCTSETKTKLTDAFNNR